MVNIRVKNCPSCSLFNKAWADKCQVCGHEFTDEFAGLTREEVQARGGAGQRTRKTP